MRIFKGILILMLVCNVVYAAPTPTASRPVSYTTGTTVDADDQNSNENTIYNQYNTHTHGDISTTTSTTFQIGDDTDVDHDFIVNNGDTNNPRIRYDSGTNKFQITNDGTTYADIPTTTGSGARGVLTGMELVLESFDELLINAGECEIDDELVGTTSQISLDITSSNNWIGGTVADDASTEMYVYAFDDGSGSNIATFNYSKVAPDATDEEGNTGGILKYYSTGGVDYRVIGSVYNDTNSNFLGFRQIDDEILVDAGQDADQIAYLQVTTVESDNVWSGATASKISTLSTYGLFGFTVVTTGDGTNTWFEIKPADSGRVAVQSNGVGNTDNNAGQIEYNGSLWSETDSNQQIKYYNGGNNPTLTELRLRGYKLNIR